MSVVLKKLKESRAGFTLAETLICVLILLMVSAIVGAAMPSAANAYKNVVDAANAQVLLSTTLTALRDEFSTAKQVQWTSGRGLGRGQQAARCGLPFCYQVVFHRVTVHTHTSTVCLYILL